MLTRACLILVLTAAPAGAFEIGLPIGCDIGNDCFIQNYVDRDEGPGAQDYACGSETYDGHKGTDIRLRSTADVEKGVPVLAVAPGIVVGTRDSMPDRLVRNDADRAAVGEQECGNGARMDHGGGWFTQYCQMHRGSVAVKTGDKVETAKIDEVAYSGMATFPRAHLTVEKDGKTVDPFLAAAGVACGETGPSLWSPAAKEQLPYRAGVLLALGVTDHPIALEELEDGVPRYRNPIRPRSPICGPSTCARAIGSRCRSRRMAKRLRRTQRRSTGTRHNTCYSPARRRRLAAGRRVPTRARPRSRARARM
jgi:hypothetical protein